MSSIQLQSRLPRTYKIIDIKQATENVRIYTFDGSLGAKPGQFVMAWVPGVDEVPLSVAYDDGANIQLAFFAVGDCTEALARMGEGDLVGLRGPFGTYYEWEPGQHIALVAGGYGAAPMFFVASESVHHGTTIEVIVGARSKEHLLFLEELESLPHVALHVATNDGSMGFEGFNVTVLENMLKLTQDSKTEDPAIDQVFACGPEVMLKATHSVCAKYNVPCQLSMERYMKCGYGLCGNCVMDPLGIRMCTEGPVVKGEVLAKLDEFGKYHRDSIGKKNEF
ncbi:dihydroorotate dehydrogenase electron transfer subunit [Candidatus Peregrinibacteria bacterium CG10_big_fil_rev_8_21_14_0_10_49_24]|nr:MAG: dihydroorotate dehydrogenase electron transfer subunit [Candidatus Peregrinibacteria bacterium CG11_big_fil_rev_8_21_14_0_20_49_14]PIR50541.1 MAG: dihydroorotate dehydrogenase electron transfer subunit [Candidatus Peregrinibacteria bacterium CG10_big_fil_rev_8_21_14_0_10_49_24]PJA67910.1 MAG: dihydroorotate dehydrogenase electron transfer subunit [Candidatus Peregrinibacteria bacterium CG_4_9_14_3_um_filter_49_12]